MFLLPHAPSTLANCYRMHSIRQQRATACAAYASNWLPHAQHTLAKHRIFDDLLLYAQCTLANCYCMRNMCQQFATACAIYASNLLPHAQHTLAKNPFLHDFATACAVCAINLLPYAQCALAKCYRMRSIRQQNAAACAAYASKADHTLILPF